MNKKLLLHHHPCYFPIYFEKLYLFCVVLVPSTKARILYEALLFKTVPTRWGGCGPGCRNLHASCTLHTIVACFDFGRNDLPASKHRIRTIGFKY